MQPRLRTRRAGFTLIELLAVIVILGILMVFLIPRLTGVRENAEVSVVRSFLKSLDAAIAEYEDRFGDFPPSQFTDKWGAPPNSINIGAEALVLSLWSPEWGGTTLSDDKLINTDGDETKKQLAKFPRLALFELRDEWGNPIAYFHRRDFARQETYLTIAADTGEKYENTVKARINPATKTFYNSNKYQLISAGPDGKFGSGEDDIYNFELSAEDGNE